MFSSLSNYLNKFKNLSSNEYILKGDLVDILKKELNIKIDKENIKIKKGCAYIKAHPAIRNEIFLKKEELLEKISNISDIR